MRLDPRAYVVFSSRLLHARFALVLHLPPLAMCLLLALHNASLVLTSYRLVVPRGRLAVTSRLPRGYLVVSLRLLRGRLTLALRSPRACMLVKRNN